MNSNNTSLFVDVEVDQSCTFSFNNTNPELMDHFLVEYNLRIITIVIPIVVALGLFGNITFLFVIFRLKSMRNMTNLYLANLAIADMCVLIAASIQYFSSYVYSAPLDVSLIGYTFRTPFGCSLPNLLNYSCYFASIWFITLVAMERYLAICHPLKHIVIRSKGRAFRLILLAWLLSLTMGVFSAPYAGIENICLYGPSNGPLGNMPRKISRCTSLCSTCDFVLWAIDTMQFFIAMFCNTYLYGRIIYTLNKVVTDSSHLAQESTRVRNQENRDNVAKMLSINALVFFFSLAPFMIINLNALSKENLLNSNIKNGFTWVARTAYLFNSAVDPYLFSGINRRYRQAFITAFTTWRTPGKRSNPSQNTKEASFTGISCVVDDAADTTM